MPLSFEQYIDRMASYIPLHFEIKFLIGQEKVKPQDNLRQSSGVIGSFQCVQALAGGPPRGGSRKPGAR